MIALLSPLWCLILRSHDAMQHDGYAVHNTHDLCWTRLHHAPWLAAHDVPDVTHIQLILSSALSNFSWWSSEVQYNKVQLYLNFQFYLVVCFYCTPEFPLVINCCLDCYSIDGLVQAVGIKKRGVILLERSVWRIQILTSYLNLVYLFILVNMSFSIQITVITVNTHKKKNGTHLTYAWKSIHSIKSALAAIY